MVNKGRISRELGKFLMISSNLIKSDDEMMKENAKTNPRNQESLNFNLISRRNHRMNIINSNYDSKMKSKAIRR